MEEATIKMVPSIENTSETAVWAGPEKEMYRQISRPEPALDFPVKEIKLPNGEIEIMYVIPEDKLLENVTRLWPFADTPKEDSEYVDIHCNKKCTVKDLKIIRFECYNMVVSPYYAKAGGTVLDLVDPSMAREGVLEMPCRKIDDSTIEPFTVR